MNIGFSLLDKLKQGLVQVNDLNRYYFLSSEDDLIIENLLKLFEIGLFKQVVDKYKSEQDTHGNPCLKLLLKNKKLFQELIKNNELHKSDLEYLMNKIDKDYELVEFRKNTTLLAYIIDVCSFQRIVDKYKERDRLYLLLELKKTFYELNTKLTVSDLKSLLDTIDESYEVSELCRNTPLIKRILNEFLFDNANAKRFRSLISFLDIFAQIEFLHKNNDEILKLNELNKYTYSFDLNLDQKLELVEVLKNNEIAKNRLIEIVDNNLESNYDFDSLMQYLNKKEKKISINI